MGCCAPVWPAASCIVAEDGAVVGRRDDATIRVDHELVSRSHAVLRRTDTAWVLEDLGSSNGTFVDGAHVERVRITSTVAVRFGDPDTGPLVEFRVPAREPVLEPVLEPALAPAPAAGTLSEIYRPESTVVRIGRAADNDLVIDDLVVSRRHAELRADPDGTYEIVDLGSHNGTFLNGRPVARPGSRARDIVGIGHSAFCLVGDQLQEYVDTGEVSLDVQDLTVAVTTAARPCWTTCPSRWGRSACSRRRTQRRRQVHAPQRAHRPAPADHGTVLYDGRDLYRDYAELRQRIGLVPQDDILHAQLTVRGALVRRRTALPAGHREGRTQARVDEVIRELGLEQRAKQPVHSSPAASASGSAWPWSC